MGKTIVRSVLLLAVVGLGAAGWLVHGMAKIGSGYAAKQLCSGVFVSGLPAEFVLDKDIRPRLATVPVISALISTEVGPSFASARGMGVTATATYQGGTGCTLYGQQPADGQRPAAPTVQTAPETLSPVFSEDTVLTEIIDSAFLEPEGGGRNTLALVVMHRGEVVAEQYAPPVHPGSRLQGWSMNKSLMASFVGLQVAAGKIDLEMRVTARLAELGVPAADFPGMSDDLTLEHLLSMSSGLDFDERYFPGDDVTEMLYGGVPMWQVPARQDQRHPPGTAFSYSSGDTNLVSYLWQSTLAGEPYPVWLDREVYGPLGLDAPILESDVSGIQVGSSFAFLTARDWARMGQWWLDAWHGRDDRLSRQWQRFAVTPGVGAGGENYGLGFWLNTGQRMFPELPDTTFHAGGNSGQLVVVIPDSELVVVRLGLTLDESKSALGPVLAELQAWAVNSATGPG